MHALGYHPRLYRIDEANMAQKIEKEGAIVEYKLQAKALKTSLAKTEAWRPIFANDRVFFNRNMNKYFNQMTLDMEGCYLEPIIFNGKLAIKACAALFIVKPYPTQSLELALSFAF